MKESTNPRKKQLLIDQWMIDYLKGYNLKVLRDKKDNTAINVSYTEAGLRWTTNKGGKLIYFKSPKKFISTDYATVIGAEINSDIITEPFIPYNHYKTENEFDVRKQLAELYIIDKAMRLVTPMNDPRNDSPSMDKY